MTNANELSNSSCCNVAVRRPETTRTGTEWTYRPNVDIIDTDSAIEVHADLPGAASEEIDVAFEQGILSIDARVSRRDSESWRRVGTEFGVGHFHRRFQIDANIEPDGISANYANGVMKIVLPKKSEAQRRKIPVKA